MNRAAYVDPTARLFGNVSLGEDCSLWPYAVIRCERNHVSIGTCTSLQDHAMVHIGWNEPTIIGAYCTIGHRLLERPDKPGRRLQTEWFALHL